MDRTVDILHPSASLEWRQCRRLPVKFVAYAKSVWLKDKVYVGGGWIMVPANQRDYARLYIYTPATNEWTTLDTPVYDFALTTYHSQLVLVSGVEYVGENAQGKPTNKLWTLSEDDQWQETLPPIPTPGAIDASAVSHGDHLLVIQNELDFHYHFNKFYVYNGHHWTSAQRPPMKLYSIMSTVFNGDLYVLAGRGAFTYSVSLESLLASCQPSETSQPSSVWKRLTFLPTGLESPAVFGNRPVAVQAFYNIMSLYAYSSVTDSWVYKGDSPPASSHQNSCAVALPSNELMVVMGDDAFIATLKSDKEIPSPNATSMDSKTVPLHPLEPLHPQLETPSPTAISANSKTAPAPLHPQPDIEEPQPRRSTRARAPPDYLRY